MGCGRLTQPVSLTCDDRTIFRRLAGGGSASPRMIFIETEPGIEPPRWGSDDAPQIVYAPHWYDGFVLFMKRFSPVIAADMFTGRVIWLPGRIRRSFARQLEQYKRQAAGLLGGGPTLIGEIGITYDLNDRQAYQTGNFSAQIRAMDRSLRAIEDNLLSCTIWNYTADNDNARGDQWNGEDLSIFSRDQQTDPEDINSGGRALEAVVRPYPRATAGEPLRLSFDYKSGVFLYEFRHHPAVEAPTEIFVPDFQYPGGYDVQVSDGEYARDRANQTLVYRHGPEQATHTIRIGRR